MLALNATQVRNEWSTVLDSVIRDKPKFIKRTRDYLLLADLATVEQLLEPYIFTTEELVEDDGSITLSLDQIDLVENGKDRQEATKKMAAALLEYAEDYYTDFAYWARGDRKTHIPYVLKALIINDIDKIGEQLQCRHGES